MARTYSIIMQSQSVNAARDLISLQAPTDHRLVVCEATVMADAVATAVMAPVGLWRATTIGSGTNSVSAVQAWQPDDVAYSTLAGAACQTNLTTTATTKDGQPLRRTGVNLAGEGFEFDGCIYVPKGGIIVLRVDAAITATSLTAELVFEVQ